MTDPTPTTQEEFSSETLGLARLLASHPVAQEALRRSIERQQQARTQTLDQAKKALRLACPHCGAPGIVYLTLPSKDGPRQFMRRPMDCCQHALRDAAENALHYALNPHSDAIERIEAADQYIALKDAITDEALLRELRTHELILADIEARVTSLPSSQGGTTIRFKSGGSGGD